MSDEPKTIADIKAGEREHERVQNRRAFFARLRGIVKFFLIMGVFAYLFIHRVQIGMICHKAFEGAMRRISLSNKTQQKAADYQSQIDEVTTN